uniref:UDP-N-acetylglucosamine transferase subunit ALG14 n=1 Tax=Parastrongyloides trichosuri TaxID=131310 RepID=A0A0N4ZLN8_PARTI
MKVMNSSLYDEVIVLSFIGFIFILSIIYFLILTYVKRHSKKPYHKISEKCILNYMAVMGSGGHTMELSMVIKSLKEKCYMERYYIIADTDKLSEEKIHTLEKETFDYGKYVIRKIPRSREVGQSYLTSIFTTIKAQISSFKIIFELQPNVLFINGPGTAIPIVFSVFILDLLCIKDCRILFMESFARVTTLSLTGKILYYTRLADVFIVQWKDLVKKYPRAEYIPFFYAPNEDIDGMIINDKKLN